MNRLAIAIAIAAKAHEKHTDRGGKAYILHPIRIMMRLRTDDDDLMCIAILHDVMEDCPEVTLDALLEAGMSERVISALKLMTHDKSEDYQDYIKRISTNYDAILVKLEDIKDNSDITRLKGLREKDFDRMEKYHRAFLYLKNAKKSHEDCFRS